MKTAKVLLVALLATLAASAAVSSLAQTGEKPRDPPVGIGDCPTVTVSCPDMGTLGSPITFSANISGGDPAWTPSFKWTAPGFRILSGQGTASITVEPPAHGGTVVATVEVG
ncbi:MAG: hypothetical protein ACJ74T_00520, partial [Pyrinomonadaceae bacterium]